MTTPTPPQSPDAEAGYVPPTQEEIDAAYAWADRIVARIEEAEQEYAATPLPGQRRTSDSPPEEETR